MILLALLLYGLLDDWRHAYFYVIIYVSLHYMKILSSVKFTNIIKCYFIFLPEIFIQINHLEMRRKFVDNMIFLLFF